MAEINIKLKPFVVPNFIREIGVSEQESYEILGEPFYALSFYHHYPPKITIKWPWFAMFPSVSVDRCSRRHITLTKEEGNHLIGEQNFFDPSWTLLFKAVTGRSEPIVSWVQIEEIWRGGYGITTNYIPCSEPVKANP